MNIEYEVSEKAATASRILLLVLLCWTIVYPIYFIYKVIEAYNTRYMFYADRFVMKRGIIQKDTKTQILTQIISVNVDTTPAGSIFGYGNVFINLVGKSNISLNNIKNPRELCEYLESKLQPISTNNQFITE